MRRLVTSEIVELAAAGFGLRAEDLRRASRRPEIVEARRKTAWLVARLTGKPASAVAHALGCDPTTVCNYLRDIQGRRAADFRFAAACDLLELEVGWRARRRPRPRPALTASPAP